MMGDDGIGVLAVERLQARPDLPPGVTVIDGGTGGVGLIPLMEGCDRVILVDAVPMGLPAGSIRRLTWDEVRLVAPEQSLSLHQSDLTGALVLAQALDTLPQEVIIYGVQPLLIEWDQPLSQPVERALPVLVDALMHEVRS